jgi:hypothetical protein
MSGFSVLPLSFRSPIYLLAGAASLGIFVSFQSLRNTARNTALHSSTPSPLKSLLPSLSLEESQRLPYPPDYFPGARDVETPYGSVRVYEFGPETGKRVLFVHGISTPCISLGGLADALVKKGCRVMLFGKTAAVFLAASSIS